MWDLAANCGLVAELGGHAGVVYAVSACDNRVVSGGADKAIKLWNIDKVQGASYMKERQRLMHSYLGHSGVVSAVIAFGNGKWLASGSWDCTVRVRACLMVPEPEACCTGVEY